MPTAWFIAPYKQVLSAEGPTRYCAMDDATTLIRADGGDWHESEYLGDRAIVKVRASTTTLADIATAPGIRRLPKDRFDDPLSDLTTAQKRAIRDELLDAGYTIQEIRARFGNDLGAYTLADVIRFALSRRRKPRWDGTQFVFDGVVQTCRNALDVHRRCFDDADVAQLISLRDTLIAEWQATQQTIRISQRLPGLPKWKRDELLVMLGREGFGFDAIRPDTFPTTGILDDFNRADGDLGANWTGPFLLGTNDLAIVSNQATGASVAVCTDGYNVATYGPDSEVRVSVPTRNGHVSVFLRLSGLGSSVDAYQFRTDNVSNWQYHRWDNDSFTLLGSTISDSAAYTAIGADMIGSTLTGYRETSGTWTAFATRTDATYTAAGYIGMRVANTTIRLDDFGGGTVVTGRASKNTRDHAMNYMLHHSEGIGRRIGGAKLFQMGDCQNEIATLGKERKFWFIPQHTGVGALRREGRP